jgi:hypothetical protein
MTKAAALPYGLTVLVRRGSDGVRRRTGTPGLI